MKVVDNRTSYETCKLEDINVGDAFSFGNSLYIKISDGAMITVDKYDSNLVVDVKNGVLTRLSTEAVLRPANACIIWED